MKRYVWIVLVLVLALVLCGAQAPPADPGWGEFLQLLTSAKGLPAIYGIVLAILLDLWPYFGELSKRQKFWCFLAIAVGIPYTAALLGVLTAGWPWGWDATFWPALLAGVQAFATGTVTHRLLPDGLSTLFVRK